MTGEPVRYTQFSKCHIQTHLNPNIVFDPDSNILSRSQSNHTSVAEFAVMQEKCSAEYRTVHNPNRLCLYLKLSL